MNVEPLLDRFHQFYGAYDFQGERYKAKRGEEMREWLGQEAIRQLVKKEQWSEMCERAAKSFSMGGPLARWDEYQWVLDLEGEEQYRFATALEQFLYGSEPFLDRLQVFVTDATAVYRELKNRDTKAQGKYRRKSLAWPFVSYFHFMMWPDQEYVFVKPSPLREASQLAGFDLAYRSQPNPSTYKSVRDFYRALWPAVERIGGQDWIDVQTVIHVAGEGFDVPKGGWIDQRQDDTWTRQIAQWQAKYLSSERIAARRDAEQRARKLLEDRVGHFDLKTLDEFLALLNADYFEGQTKNN